MKNLLSTVVLLCAMLLPITVPALQPLITDDTGTQGANNNQIEIEYSRTADKSEGAKTFTRELPLVYTRGVTDALDIYASANYQRITPPAPDSVENGLGNMVLGAKWRFYEDESGKLSFALKPEILFPVSERREARGLGSARISYGIGLLLSRETGFGAIHANLMVDRTNYADVALDAAQRRTTYRLSAAPVWAIASKWTIALDAGILTNPERSAKARMGYLEIGAIYSPGKDLDFDIGLIRNVHDGAVRTLQLVSGVTWRF